jgi:hypothetical protein
LSPRDRASVAPTKITTILGAEMDITLSHNSTDDELLAAVARGDRVAFAELYDRFAPHVLARVTSEVADTRQALDTVADVFVEFWRQAPRLDRTAGRVATWMFTAPFAHDGLAEGALAS